jgi:hypothetical protein
MLDLNKHAISTALLNTQLTTNEQQNNMSWADNENSSKFPNVVT